MATTDSLPVSTIRLAPSIFLATGLAMKMEKAPLAVEVGAV